MLRFALSAAAFLVFKCASGCCVVMYSMPAFGNSLPTVLPSLLSQDMNNLDEGVEFLPAMNSEKMEKRGPKRRVVVTVLIIVFLLVSLTTGLLFWHFKCECDIWWVVTRRVTRWKCIHSHGKKSFVTRCCSHVLSQALETPLPPPCPNCCH